VSTTSIAASSGLKKSWDAAAPPSSGYRRSTPAAGYVDQVRSNTTRHGLSLRRNA
jgi:hypothetical protein